jgi:acyl-CoA thioesterase FadM
VYILLSLGYSINRYLYLVYSSIVATIVDKVIGILISINKKQRLVPSQGDTVTAYLYINYLKPVATLQTVLVNTWFREVTGRKYFIDRTVKDSSGTVLITAEAL